MAVTTTKTCRLCGENKPSDAFHRNKQQSDGRHPWCAKCKNAKAAGYYQGWNDQQREKHRGRVLKTRYGISAEQYNEMLSRQRGACAICGSRSPGRKNQRFSVDHSHQTGRVRGLLCNGCNVGIAHFGDDPLRLLAAVEYLKGGQ